MYRDRKSISYVELNECRLHTKSTYCAGGWRIGENDSLFILCWPGLLSLPPADLPLLQLQPGPAAQLLRPAPPPGQSDGGTEDRPGARRPGALHRNNSVHHSSIKQNQLFFNGYFSSILFIQKYYLFDCFRIN